MITQPARIFLPLLVVGVVAAVIYSGMTGDHTGISLFLGLGTVAFLAGVAITTARDNEVAPVVAPDAGPPELRPALPARLPGGPGWPALAALAGGLVALSFLTTAGLAVAGLVVALAAAVGWLASASGDRTGHVPNLMPIGIPVVGLFAIASLIALKPNVSSRSLMTALVVGGVLMAGGGLVAGAAGQRHIEAHGEHSGRASLSIKARNVAFDLQEFDLHAEQPAVIEFENEEAQPHNVAIYFTEEFSTPVWQGDVITGPETIEYRFTAPKAGTYFFRCDIHPAMKGKVHVE